ncbi:thiolase family protein [Lentilactobacillus sp. Marseille-Q4993]|uniref:thiolase family protein n=1 Tax=Lentilactobacillus sp. Marseille-Q4993 TaxID=3039492 RepID=UPI0024BD43EF|nr:thiolase family protein [Lentilactobacillus sp. Marseille-Q4993]
MAKTLILDAKRTPIGKLNGKLSSFSAVELGTTVAKELLNQTTPNQIDQVIFGNAIQAGNGQNPARQILINSNIPNSRTAFTVNQVCGSGMKAIHLAHSALQLNEASLILAGGTESMSNVPFYDLNRRKGTKFGNQILADGLSKDGLDDAFSNQPMGITAENVAAKYHVSREEQDELALRSHVLAKKAINDESFKDELIPINIAGTNMTSDESVRFDTSLEKLAGLKPVFKENGTVTAGNAAGLNDGAAGLLLTTDEKLADIDTAATPTAEIIGYTEVGTDPNYMGYAPYYAISKLLDNLKMEVSDIDLFEINEAFASQVVAVARDLHIDFAKLNILGGGLALGHPLGDSGARIVSTLINNLNLTNKTYGIASLCMGGGMGAAIAIKKL